MQRLAMMSLVVYLSVVWLGCAGSAGSGGTDKAYTMDLGIATVNGVRDQVQQIIVNRHHYLLRYFDESSDRIYVETDWKERAPFEDEDLIGVRQARSRIIIEARSRIRSGETSTYSVKFKGENQLLFRDKGEWERGHMTDDSRDYFKDIAYELKDRFLTRTREY